MGVSRWGGWVGGECLRVCVCVCEREREREGERERELSRACNLRHNSTVNPCKVTFSLKKGKAFGRKNTVTVMAACTSLAVFSISGNSAFPRLSLRDSGNFRGTLNFLTSFFKGKLHEQADIKKATNLLARHAVAFGSDVISPTLNTRHALEERLPCAKVCSQCRKGAVTD